MLVYRASLVLGPLLSALAFATYANPVFELLIDGSFFSRLTRTGRLAASFGLLLLLHAVIIAVGRAGEAARRRRRRRRGGGVQLVEIEGDDEGGRMSEGERTPTTERTPVLGGRRKPRSDEGDAGDEGELGGAAPEAEAEAGTESLAAAQRTMARTLRSLMATQQQTAEQLATLTGALAGLQQGLPPPPPSTPFLPHPGTAGARGGSGAGQPDSSTTPHSNARRVTLSHDPATPEQPLIELESETGRAAPAGAAAGAGARGPAPPWYSSAGGF